MDIHIITLFPEYFSSPLASSLLGKAIKDQLVNIHYYALRSFSKEKHHNVDDRPFGGGAGMILTPQPLFDCLEHIKSKKGMKRVPVIYFTPRGGKLTQKKVERFSQYESLILLCGRYEGIDQRVIDTFVDHEISIGDYVLAGGEVASLVFIEAVTRFIPGVLGNYDSTKEESFSDTLDGKKEYPLYTQPREFRGLKVPEVLLSGNHKAIEDWKKKNCK